MFEQRVCCIKVVLPEKEMPALSVTIQRRKVARNGATEQRPLVVEVVMDQHGSQYLLLVVGRRIVGVAKEIVEKELVGGVHFRTLANCRTACGRRRRRRPARGVAARTDQLAALPASDECDGVRRACRSDVAGAARRLLGRGRLCGGESGVWWERRLQTPQRSNTLWCFLIREKGIENFLKSSSAREC